jgi:uncharacterized membrane protein
MGSAQPFYHVRHSLEFQAPVDKVFGHWTDFRALPGFLDGVESVRKLSDSRYLFQFSGPTGRDLLWDAIITRLVPNQYIEWRSDSQSPIQCAGRARFRERPGSTKVDLEVEYGPVTALAASAWMTAEANRFLEKALPDYLAKDVFRIKDLIETGSTGL